MTRLRPIAQGELARTCQDYRDAFEALRGARVFVSGGTGFIGKWLISMLVFARREAGIDVSACVLSRNPATIAASLPEVYGDPAITLHRGDVRSFEVPASGFTHVVHAATDSLGELAADPLLHFDSIVGGTRRMLDAAASKGAAGFLMLSSGAVYRPIKTQAGAAESDIEWGGPDPTNPMSAYAEGKRAAELQCAIYTAAGRVPVQIARCFSFVGPFLELNAHFAIGNFIRDAIAGQNIRVGGDGSPLRSFLYAGDLIGWLLTILAKGQPGTAYNVGSDQAVTIRELAESVRDTLAPDGRVVVAAQPDPSRRADVYVPSITRARKELGLSIRRDLKDAIAATAAWARLSD